MIAEHGRRVRVPTIAAGVDLGRSSAVGQGWDEPTQRSHLETGADLLYVSGVSTGVALRTAGRRALNIGVGIEVDLSARAADNPPPSHAKP